MILTDAKIRAAQPPQKGYTLTYDEHRDSPPGFGLRVTAKGTKSFILRYNAEGRDRRMTIGQYPTWTLAAARKEANQHKRVVDGGTDILEERRIERGKLTVAQAVERFSSEHFDQLKTGAASRSRLERFVAKPLGHRKLHDVRRAELRDIVAKLGRKHGRQAGLLLSNLKSLFTWAEDNELIEGNPVATLRPAKVSKSLKPVSRTRVLDDEEVRAFWGGIDEASVHRFTALALKLVLVTGQRPGEVCGMRWSEIHGKTWTIPASRRGKTNTEHHVPLTDTALALLEEANQEAKRLGKRRKSGREDIVFPTRVGAALDVNALGKAVRRHDLGTKDHPDWGPWTPHDLRRTMRTGLAAERIPPMVAELAIGHVKKGIIGTYDAHHYAGELREALEAWERRLGRVLEGKPADDAKVTPLRRERAS